MTDEPLVSILLPGDPVGKGRPRFRIVKPRGKPQFVTVYTPKETAEYEARLANVGRVEMAGRAPFACALSLLVEVFVPIPASWSKKKRADAVAGAIPAVSKPDFDNFGKIAGDALNKIVWLDDSLIVAGQIIKQYSDFPRMRVSVWKWDDVDDEQRELLLASIDELEPGADEMGDFPSE